MDLSKKDREIIDDIYDAMWKMYVSGEKHPYWYFIDEYGLHPYYMDHPGGHRTREWDIVDKSKFIAFKMTHL